MNQRTVFISGIIGLIFGILFSGTLGLDFFGETTDDFQENQINDEATLEEIFMQKYNLDDSIYIPISGDDAYMKIDNDESFILYIGRYTCPYCQQHVPNLMEAAESNGLTMIYHVDMLDSGNDDFVSTENIVTTPTTYIVINGEVVEILLGYKTTSELEMIIGNHFND